MMFMTEACPRAKCEVETGKRRKGLRLGPRCCKSPRSFLTIHLTYYLFQASGNLVFNKRYDIPQIILYASCTSRLSSHRHYALEFGLAPLFALTIKGSDKYHTKSFSMNLCRLGRITSEVLNLFQYHSAVSDVNC